MNITSQNWNRNFRMSVDGKLVFRMEYNRKSRQSKAKFQGQDIQIKPKNWFSNTRQIIKEGKNCGKMMRAVDREIDIHLEDQDGKTHAFFVKADISFRTFVLHSAPSKQKLITLQRINRWMAQNKYYEVEMHVSEFRTFDLQELALYTLHSTKLYFYTNW